MFTRIRFRKTMIAPAATNEDNLCKAKELPSPTMTKMKRRNFSLGSRIGNVGKTFKKVNVLKLIDDMEKDQELADKLERLNKEMEEENIVKELIRKALADCHAEIEQHLDEFLEDLEAFGNNPFAPTYEEWIADLHPENIVVDDGENLEVDMRFYVVDSDHRLLWNKKMESYPSRQVDVRSIRDRLNSEASSEVSHD